MAITLTPNLGLKKQDFEDENWHIPLNETIDILDKSSNVKEFEVLKNIDCIACTNYELKTSDSWYNDNTKSWYNETLNTETRGDKREFPDKTIFLLTLTELIIYDASSDFVKIWIVFKINSTNLLKFSCNSIYFDSGILVVGYVNNGIEIINFKNDTSINVVSDVALTKTYNGDILERNASKNFTESDINLSLVENNTLDVFIKGNIIVCCSSGSASGVTVINNLAESFNSLQGSFCKNIFINESGELFYARSDGTDRIYITTNFLVNNFTWGRQYNTVTNPKIINDKPTDIFSIDNFLIVSTNSGLNFIYENKTNKTSGMICHIKNDYCSGFMFSDIILNVISNAVSYQLSNNSIIDDRANGNDGVVFGNNLKFEKVNYNSELLCLSGFEQSSFLKIPHASNLNFSLNDFTIVLWLKGKKSSGPQVIFDKSDINNSKQFVLYSETSGRLNFTTQSGGYTYVKTKLELKEDCWTNLIIKREGTKISFYVNGRLDNFVINTIRNVDNTNDLVIGSRNDFSSQNKNYKICLFRISKGAISNEQIEQVYMFEKKLFEPYSNCTISGWINKAEKNRIGTLNNFYEIDGFSNKKIYSDNIKDFTNIGKTFFLSTPKNLIKVV